MQHKTNRFRRLLALLIDWNISWLPAFLVGMLLLPLVTAGRFPIPLLIPVIVSFPLLFLFRDRLFRGRSLGNRIMKLVVLDRRTLQPLSKSSLTTRNLLFLFLGGLEPLLLLTTGATLGDRAVAALVVHQDEIPTEPPQRTPANTKTILVTVVAVILGIALFVGLILLSLEQVKEEPHYTLAYEYLLSSETFAALGGEEHSIRFSGYSQSTSMVDGVAETKAVFTFMIKGQSLDVTCHEDDTGWYVCRECTHFS